MDKAQLLKDFMFVISYLDNIQGASASYRVALRNAAIKECLRQLDDKPSEREEIYESDLEPEKMAEELTKRREDMDQGRDKPEVTRRKPMRERVLEAMNSMWSTWFACGGNTNFWHYTANKEDGDLIARLWEGAYYEIIGVHGSDIRELTIDDIPVIPVSVDIPEGEKNELL